MTFGDRITNEYFDWMYDLACKDRYPEQISYRKLFVLLHDTEFIYSIPRDKNRAEDGIDLRYRFSRLKAMSKMVLIFISISTCHVVCLR